MSRIVPIQQINTRPPEAGRIRLGEKTARAMKALETFRFTSQHQNSIEQLARIYGGNPTRWNEPKARVKNQWQVTTEASTISVYLPLGGMDTWYEMWTGGGCARRCNGVTVEVPVQTPDGSDTDTAPCICDRKGVMECRPYTRLNVFLPQIPFQGTWRLETKGWNAAAELPGMYEAISQMAAAGKMVDATLTLEKRSKVHNGKTSNFVVPTLQMNVSPAEILSGGGAPERGIEAPTERPQLEAVPDDDDEVVEAELVEDDDDLLVEQQLRDALPSGIDADAFVAAIWNDTNGDLSKITNATKRIRQGAITPTGVDADGRPTWEN